MVKAQISSLGSRPKGLVRGLSPLASLVLLLGFVACGSRSNTDETLDLAHAERSGANGDKTESEGSEDGDDTNVDDENDDGLAIAPSGSDRCSRKHGRGQARRCADAGVPVADAGVPVADAGVPVADAGVPVADAGLRAPDAGAAAPDAGSSCANAVTPTSNGHHHSGDSCGSCHTGQGGAPLWTLAGTLFNGVSSSTPVAGATVRVTDAMGRTLSLISATNGNFWTSQALSFPVKVSVSKCPDTAEMSGSVSAPASCNACHTAGFRVHLP